LALWSPLASAKEPFAVLKLAAPLAKLPVAVLLPAPLALALA
jgi:hypothetical protein